MKFPTSIRSAGLALIVATSALTLMATGAEASNVTIGSPLSGSLIQGEVNSPTTLVTLLCPSPAPISFPP